MAGSGDFHLLIVMGSPLLGWVCEHLKKLSCVNIMVVFCVSGQLSQLYLDQRRKQELQRSSCRGSHCDDTEVLKKRGGRLM